MLGILEIAIALSTLAFITLLYFKRLYNYWEKRQVAYIEPTIPWGSSGNPITSRKSLFVRLKEFYDEFKSKGKPFGGFYLMSKPILLVLDTELIKRVLSKDFQYFTGHGIHVDEEKDPLSGNLFSLDGEKWKNMRVKLTPTFTSGKMKMMFPGILVCGEPMIEHINNLCSRGEILNIKEILACFTTDVIGSSAFGIECNSFKDPDAEFRRHGRRLFEPSWSASFLRFLKLIIPKLRLSALSKETRQFFFDNFTRIVNYREQNNFKRNDFVQLLLELKQKNDGKDGLNINQMIAQSIMFFAAGFETSSTTMTFCLHELSYNLDIQERLRNEINSTMQKYDGKLTYEGVMEMKYLNMVLDETLRKFPPGSLINRICNKDYIIPETHTVIEAGTRVFVSILGLHRDPEYFPNPEKFDPERFSDENKHRIQPYAYLPFGEGPRICIGLRFGVLQAKVGLCLLLKNFIFTPHKSMNYKMEINAHSQVLSFRDDLLLMAQSIK